jgi:hypothetical protein
MEGSILACKVMQTVNINNSARLQLAPIMFSLHKQAALYIKVSCPLIKEPPLLSFKCQPIPSTKLPNNFYNVSCKINST